MHPDCKTAIAVALLVQLGEVDAAGSLLREDHRERSLAGAFCGVIGVLARELRELGIDPVAILQDLAYGAAVATEDDLDGSPEGKARFIAKMTGVPVEVVERGDAVRWLATRASA